MTTPDVSVIIPAWNAGASIARAVGSVLASTGVSIEVVVVDDASPDDTYVALATLAAGDSRVVIDRLSVNSGPSAARNRAIELARGRFLAVVDADDVVTPDRFSKLVAIANDGGADVVVDNMIEVDEAGHIVGEGRFLKLPKFGVAREINLLTWVSFNQPMKAGDCLGYLKPLIRRSTLDRLGVRYDAALRNSEDYYLVAELLSGGAQMTYTPDAGYHYTRAAGSTSHRLKTEHTRALIAAEQRFHKRHAGHLSPPDQAALAKRMRALRNVDQFVAAVDALKDKRFGAFFGLLSSDPTATGFTLTTFAKVAAGKVLRRKFV